MIFLLPLLMAIMPFIFRGGHAYIENVAFCWLPLVPRWYRWTLAWTPRIVIAITIMTISLIAISRVWRRIRALHRTKPAISSTASHSIPEERLISRRTQPEVTFSQKAFSPIQHGVKTTQTMFSRTWLKMAQSSTTKQEDPIIRKGQDPPSSTSMRPPQSSLLGRTSSMRDEANRQVSNVFETASSAEGRSREKKMLRKLPKLLIYPSIYAILWLAPLIQFVRPYTDIRSEVLLSFALVCRCSMGFVNAFCFSCLKFLIVLVNQEDFGFEKGAEEV